MLAARSRKDIARFPFDTLGERFVGRGIASMERDYHIDAPKRIGGNRLKFRFDKLKPASVHGNCDLARRGNDIRSAVDTNYPHFFKSERLQEIKIKAYRKIRFAAPAVHHRKWTLAIRTIFAKRLLDDLQEFIDLIVFAAHPRLDTPLAVGNSERLKNGR